MEILPDDLWHHILKIGTETERLDHKDLCSLSMTCHRLDELAQDSALWTTLFDRDILTSSAEAPSKALYKEEFLKDISIWREFKEFEAMMANWSFTSQVPELYEYDEYPFFLESINIYHPPYYEFGFSDNNDNDDNANDVVDDDNLFQFIGGEAIGQSSMSQPRNVPTKKKFPKRRNKGPRPAVYPNNKSYIPMHKPPRRAMARKI